MKILKKKNATTLITVALIFCLVLAAFFSIASVKLINAVAVTATVGVGATPDGAVYDSAKSEVFVSSAGPGSVSVISDTTNAVVATVGVGTAPLGLAYDSGMGEIWVSNSGTAYETVISDSTNTAIRTVTVTTTIAAYPLGACYDSAKGEIFVANGFQQNVAVVSDSTNTVVANIALATPSYPYADAYDSAKGEIFVAEQQINAVVVISDSTNAVVASIPVGSSPQSICYDPAKGEIFVGNFGSNTVSVISDATNTVVATINVSSGPSGLAYDSGQSEVWVTCEGANTVSAISDATNAVVGTAAVGDAPSAVAYDSGKSEIFVTNSGSSNVSVLSDSGPFSTATPPPVVPPLSIPTWCLIQVSPNPVGIGQPIYMQAFLTKPTPTVGVGGVGDHYQGLTIKITAPDGKVTTMGPYTADPTGGVPSLEFTPTQLGNYSFQATYPGQYLKTAGAYFDDYEEPSVSPVVVVVVQQTPISTIQSPPLPTAYWNFPIEATNYGWSVLAGDWLGGTTYDATSNFNPYTTAPTTAHIMWTKQTSEGGQPGGPAPGDEMHNFMTTSILVSCFDGIIMNGVLYYEEYNSMDSSPTSWNAVDLRTGQLLWSRAPGIGTPAAGTPSVAGQTTAETLRYGSIYSQHSMQEYGSTCLLISSIGSTWRLYSAFDGTYLGNITGVVGSSIIRDENTSDVNVGEMLGYLISLGNLIMWNETLCFAGGTTTGASPNTLRIPTTMAFSKGYQWSVAVPTTYKGNAISPALSIAKVTQDIILLRSAPSLSFGSSVGWEIDAGYNARTGALLWITNNTEPYQHYVSLGAVGNDVFALVDKDALTAYGFSMLTGKPLWGPTSFPGNALSHVSISCDAAYDQIYIFDIGGYCRAINLTSGALDWTYYPPSAGYNTPYGVYPLWVQGCQAIADGMIFLGVGRLYDPPLFENATRIALNCTTGQPVWGILGFDSKAVSPVGDGFLVTWDCYDASIYAISKGPSQITASVQNNVLSLGNSVLITGRVLDVSPGTRQAVQKYDFPDGVPCVPDSEMSAWMAYVYMQQPMPTNITGVPVDLYVLDSNHNYRFIGTTTTDATNGFYKFEWTPDITGAYTLFATYGGSQSYWPSSTETAFAVTAAPPTASPYPTPVAGIASTGTVELGVAAIIIVIVIIGIALAILTLRKRP